MATIVADGRPLDGQQVIPGPLPVQLTYAASASEVQWTVNGATAGVGTTPVLDLSGCGGQMVVVEARAKWSTWSTYRAMVRVAEPLSWAPTPLEDPETLVVTDGQNCSTKLDPARDYVISLPGSVGNPQRTPLSVKGGFNISGGRNIRIIGGAICHDADYLAGTTGSRGTSNRAMFLGDWTGDLHLEGVSIGGDWLFEGINVRSAHPNARLVAQNILIADPILALVGGGHEGGDAMQNWDGPRGGYYVDRFSVHAASYQGLFCQPAMLAGVDGAPAVNDVRRVSIDHWHAEDRAAHPLPDAPYDPPRALGNGAQQLVFSGNPERSGPWQLTNVWVNPAPKFASPRDGIAPTGLYAGSCIDWPSRSDVVGQVNIGLPSGGHWVTAGQAGINYVTPGYAGPLPPS